VPGLGAVRWEWDFFWRCDLFCRCGVVEFSRSDLPGGAPVAIRIFWVEWLGVEGMIGRCLADLTEPRGTGVKECPMFDGQPIARVAEDGRVHGLEEHLRETVG
jgi:hypothetical protein